MALEWRKAEKDQLDALVELRLRVLRAANRLSQDTPMPEIAAATRSYYDQALQDASCVILLVLNDGQIISTGSVCFYRVMPTCDVPNGQKAYIMSMYTEPEWRRQGLASETLRRLIDEAHQRGIDWITLEATDAGRPLYESMGFIPMMHEMVLL